MLQYLIHILTLTIPSVVHAFNLSTFFGFIISEKIYCI